ncbi:hypothetical protein TBLA_0J01480 [Henningerozyma blattae CBS 6284]|uniref:CBM21 domain-containing protein n=1 Tax=Henningerozyma blattae (strain ATCC 34711 / CBS 6284 / DSM 70876 / NBRC 10599 / NRRL Y-10934 / UCD 77-7) TaxID=1071380 RepID=I2H9U2_HENB6|nr:hypothetical protein TBLA_0J01480 [Tetrapisispora blattae CBS 6284]CCH63144.1 hypothetical protein TBLA_0J01480 [Tetrapisispora blattae CBS 6284]
MARHFIMQNHINATVSTLPERSLSSESKTPSQDPSNINSSSKCSSTSSSNSNIMFRQFNSATHPDFLYNKTNPSTSSSAAGVISHKPASSNINSLDFLRKPKRLPTLHSQWDDQTILERNTLRNKDPRWNSNSSLSLNTSSNDSPIKKDFSFKDLDEANDDMFFHQTPLQGPGEDDNTSNQNSSISPRTKTTKNYITGISGTVTNDTGDIRLNLLHSLDTATGVGDEIPVYKKSGELLKPSLKKRSKSLPTTPNILNSNSSKLNTTRHPKMERSKSVHFDEKAPFKLFEKDDSPIRIINYKENIDQLDFWNYNKPLTMQDYSNTTETLLTDLQMFNMNDNDLLLRSNGNTNIFSAPPIKPLRKSKKFTNAAASTISNPKRRGNTNGNSNGNIIRSNEVSPKSLSNGSTNRSNSSGHLHKVAGLYSTNFPILSNKNPKSLKLNIFVNLSQDKKCFLQDLTLYNTNNNSFGNSHTLIIGKVLVKNIFFHKRVIIKYTWNKWKTFHDIESVYLSDADGILPGTNMDIFNFIIDDSVNNVSSDGRKGMLEFCIRYISIDDANGGNLEFWDNNGGKNYKVDVII